jgi:hypothetical protein
MPTFELLDIEWSDYGDDVRVLGTASAPSQEAAVRAFRRWNRLWDSDYVREVGCPTVQLISDLSVQTDNRKG